MARGTAAAAFNVRPVAWPCWRPRCTLHVSPSGVTTLDFASRCQLVSLRLLRGGVLSPAHVTTVNVCFLADCGPALGLVPLGQLCRAGDCFLGRLPRCYGV